MHRRTIYRIEHPDDNGGMWYSGEGTPRGMIQVLCPHSPARDAPMPDNPLHRKDGKVWYSAGKSIENMHAWFTAKDALNLYSHGFRLYELEVTMYQELEHEVLFCRDGVVRQTEVALESIWDVAELLAAAGG